MEDICSICLISPIPPLNVCVTNCNHRFCKTCLETWQNRINRDCPICREDITYYMYNNNQIRPLFRYINDIPNIHNQNIINYTSVIQKLRRSLYIVTSISVTSVSFLIFMYLNEFTKINDCD